jgi:hypothetical protein
MIIVKYVPKATVASTEYRRLNKDDLTLTLDTLQKIADKFETLKGSQLVIDGCSGADIYDNYWCEETNVFQMGKWAGVNSPKSMTEGILDNFLFKSPPQYDLSNHQTPAIQFITGNASALWPDLFKEIQFYRVAAL